MKPNKEGGTMKVIGITGGIGCGKSFVMEQLKERHHVAIILTDLVAHELMEPGKKSYEQIVAHFGSQILDEQGIIDRKALGSIVFQEPKQLQILNQITHPNVKAEVIQRINRIKEEGVASMIAVEAALLIEDHYDQICEELWFVDAKDEVRIERLMQKRGYTREKCLSIMEKQLSREQFLKHCKRVIYNDTTKEDVIRQIDKIMKEVL
ncbi:MAG: dephospho-CoA kinase [Firmicutes bacterium]|uniref:Dephospho-CoA kinase n=1 Tax=Candidatus Scybalomonas excrementavium TaxID=2840943 RepID=A0A9D9HYG3_9FIRM|nr:dephospho-CoA kinase [Candidatus Scybalomonas excrementavium]